jgi:hypothetical protein
MNDFMNESVLNMVLEATLQETSVRYIYTLTYCDNFYLWILNMLIIRGFIVTGLVQCRLLEATLGSSQHGVNV